MPYFLGLFTVIYPLLKLFSGVAALVIVYDLIFERLLPLYDAIELKLTNEVSALSSCNQFCEIFEFFDIERAITVLLSAILVSVFWKLFELAAKSMAARVAGQNGVGF